MANQLISSYLKDTTVPVETRRNVANLLDSGDLQENDAVQGITKKYGNKYGQAGQDTQQPTDKPWYQAAGEFALNVGKEAVSGLAEMGAQGVKSISNQIGVLGDIGETITNPAASMRREALKQYTQTPEFNDKLNSLSPQDKQKMLNDLKPFITKPSEVMTGIGEQYAQATGSKSTEKLIGKTSGIGSTIGAGIGSIAGQIPGIVTGTEAGTAIGKSSALKMLPDWGKNIMGLLGGGAINTETMVAGEKGRLATPEELKTGAEIDLATAGAAMAIKKLGNFLFSRTIPTTITEVAKDTKKGLDIGEAVSGTGISVSKKQLGKNIQKKIQPLAAKLNSAIEAADSKLEGKTFTINDYVDNLKSEIMDNPAIKSKLKATPIDMEKAAQTIDEVSDSYRKLYGDRQLKLVDLQGIKKDLGIGLSTEYNKAVGAVARAKPLSEMQLRSNIRQEIENFVPEAKGINKDLAPLIEAASRLEKKGDRRGLLYDIMAGGFYAGSPGEAINNPLEYAKKFVLGALLRRVAGTTAAKTITGSALNTAAGIMASPIFKSALKKELLSESVDSQTK